MVSAGAAGGAGGAQWTNFSFAGGGGRASQRSRIVALLTVAGLLALFVSLVRVAPARAAADTDLDGLSDPLEQQLAERFAPALYFEPDESNYPVNVDWLMQRSGLQYHENCSFPKSDIDDDIGPAPLGPQANLLGPPYVRATDCHNTGPLSSVEADPEGGFGDDQTYVIPDLDDADHTGSGNPGDWVTYFHEYPAKDGGVMIQYWHTFPYNELSVAGFGNHGGDWDAQIQVQLGPDLGIRGVWYSRHSDDKPGSFLTDATIVGTHPLVGVDGGGHAAYDSPRDFCANRSPAGGTMSWTTDVAHALDPDYLQEVECDEGTPTGDRHGGVVWETWTAGAVKVAGSLSHPVTPGSHGGLVNLGEYNPCAPCGSGNTQAAKLLAGQFHPMNGQIFTQYEGHWGSLGCSPSPPCAGGPRGPVFQGFKDGVYTAWYNEGADGPASSQTSPFLQPPATTLSVTGATFVRNGVTFVPAATTFSLSATQTPMAASVGPVQAFSRVYPVGSAPPGYSASSAPFALPPADGAYQIDYFGVDGLGNVETTQSVQYTRDATPPVITITQPAATQYLHSGSLALDYGVSDGAGSDLASTTVALDGAATLAGHGLADGQTIDLLHELGVGTHVVSITAVDNVGNPSTNSVTFDVIVTPESIQDEVQRFVAEGQVVPEQAMALPSMLRQAAARRAREDCAGAAKVYDALIKAVQAQRGHHITVQAADILIADAQYLIAHCP